MQWKTQLFEANAKICEKDLSNKLRLEITESNRDAQLSKEMLLTTLLRKSLFPSVKGDAKEAASIGRKMEEPICKELFQEVPSILAAFWVGLVEKVGALWKKDSADFLTLPEDDGLECEETEIKTRTVVQTVGQEYNRIDMLQ